MGRASNRTARERIVSQEMTAKTIDSPSNNRKVRRQRSLWRRSNCSRRSEMAGLGAEPRDELSAKFGTFFLPSFIIPASPGLAETIDPRALPILGYVTAVFIPAIAARSLNGTYPTRHKMKTASP